MNAFADFRHTRPGIKVVFSGRPHGIDGAAMNRFGQKNVTVLSLDTKQVEAFIQKWFTKIYVNNSGIGRKNADAMIAEIKGHPSIAKLTDNPLMLTAICILYYDGKELPNQRAELYRILVDNMLFRRFSGAESVAEPDTVREFLKNLAFRMHEQGVRGADEFFAIKVLSGVIRRGMGERERDYKKRVERVFGEIEPRCGLLKFEKGQYNFWHLTFQEFLTAAYIVDNNNDYVEAIEEYWDKKRYREVIKLYIGYLCIKNRKGANTIIENAVENEGAETHARCLLAAGSMMDMQTDRRDEEVLRKTKGCLIAILEREREPTILAEAGETLGWLGDNRNLKEFVPIEGGKYQTHKGTVKIEPFEIGIYPVTNQWFEQFIEAGGYEESRYWSVEGRKWLSYTGASHPLYWGDRKWRCPNSPVVGVSWYEGNAFSRWLSEADGTYHYRLPTEIEWNAVAIGFSGKREYAWGGPWDNTRCNNLEIKLERTSPVGVFRRGDTPEAISDLTGNVWELTSSDLHSALDFDFIFPEEIFHLP